MYSVFKSVINAVTLVNSFVDEYSESMKRNQVLASSAIKRAMADANAGKLLFLSFF